MAVTYTFDPQYLEVVTAAGTAPPPVACGDWRTLRATTNEILAFMESQLPVRDEVTRTRYTAHSYDGAQVPLRWYTPQGDDRGTAGPAALYVHGGGMIAGSVDLYDRTIAAYVADSGVPLLAVDYRLAPEYPHPCPIEDAYAGLAWLHANAAALGVEPNRIALMGDSAGGGLAACATLLARDRGLSVAKQILIYPMLNDRNTVTDPVLVQYAGWTYDNNYTGWYALLGDALGMPGVPASASAVRAEDLSALPPTYVEVGDLDIFRDESIDYARRVAAAGNSVELHVHPGCPHGWERVIPNADVSERSRADRIRALCSF
jgi:acetyl esterase/lipase